MWAPFGHHFTENNAFHQGMEKAAKPSNHAALRLFSVHIKHVENDTKIYYFLLIITHGAGYRQCLIIYDFPA